MGGGGKEHTEAVCHFCGRTTEGDGRGWVSRSNSSEGQGGLEKRGGETDGKRDGQEAEGNEKCMEGLHREKVPERVAFCVLVGILVC